MKTHNCYSRRLLRRREDCAGVLRRVRDGDVVLGRIVILLFYRHSITKPVRSNAFFRRPRIVVRRSYTVLQYYHCSLVRALARRASRSIIILLLLLYVVLCIIIIIIVILLIVSRVVTYSVQLLLPSALGLHRVYGCKHV